MDYSVIVALVESRHFYTYINNVIRHDFEHLNNCKMNVSLLRSRPCYWKRQRKRDSNKLVRQKYRPRNRCWRYDLHLHPCNGSSDYNGFTDAVLFSKLLSNQDWRKLQTDNIIFLIGKWNLEQRNDVSLTTINCLAKLLIASFSETLNTNLWKKRRHFASSNMETQRKVFSLYSNKVEFHTFVLLRVTLSVFSLFIEYSN